jgi:hypothetical protein
MCEPYSVPYFTHIFVVSVTSLLGLYWSALPVSPNSTRMTRIDWHHRRHIVLPIASFIYTSLHLILYTNSSFSLCYNPYFGTIAFEEEEEKNRLSSRSTRPFINNHESILDGNWISIKLLLMILLGVIVMWEIAAEPLFSFVINRLRKRNRRETSNNKEENEHNLIIQKRKLA